MMSRIDETVDRLLEAKKDDDEINWKYHFEQFGGTNKFLSATGIKKEDLRMYISTGETPESARKKIRSAVAKRLMQKYKGGKLLERKSKFDYEIYHDTYTSAVNTALKHAEVKGYTTDPEEVASHVGFGPRKPGRGKTVTVNIPLYKNDKPQRKALHIVVYNRDVDHNTYELTTYIL